MIVSQFIKEISQNPDTMRITASYLLERMHQSEFDELIEDMKHLVSLEYAIGDWVTKLENRIGK